MQDENPLKSVSLSFICNEDWDKMHPTETGRHCDVCNKTVVDFTNRTQDDFTKAMTEANGKLCGRFKAKQTIHLPEFKFDRAAAILMATAGLSFLSAESKGQNPHIVGKIIPPKTEQPTVKGNIKAPVSPTVRGEVEVRDTIRKQPVNWVKPVNKDWKEQVLLGDTIGPMPSEPVDTATIDTTSKIAPAIVPSVAEMNMLGGPKMISPADTTKVAQHSAPVELNPKGIDETIFRPYPVGPVYPGGEQALQKAIDYNLRWPVKLAENVTVYVQIPINNEGVVTDAYMIKGYRPDVDAEAMRIARLLIFTPAKNEFGEAVNSVLTIPISFTKKE